MKTASPLVEAYAKENGFWRGETMRRSTQTRCTSTWDNRACDLRPEAPARLRGTDRRQNGLHREMEETFKRPMGKEVAVAGEDYTMESGKVVIASITSCTNTSNPYVMIGAGLVARKAAALGLNRKPWVKTSLAPGSQVVSAYLEAAELQEDLDAIGFNLVGYGCTTCIGNSGPIQPETVRAIAEGDLVATSVLSGNRNFEGASALTCAPTTWLARPSSWPMRWPVRWTSIWQPTYRAGQGRQRRLPERHLAHDAGSRRAGRTDRDPRSVPDEIRDVFKGDEKWQGVETPMRDL